MDITDYSPNLRTQLFASARGGPTPAGSAPRHHLRRVLLSIAGGAMGLVTFVAGAGALYEATAARGDAAAYPLRGRLVDVGGYRLHLDCRGEGSPTIIMDAGLGGSSLDWSLVQPQLAATSRVCSFDRAGMGWSDPGPGTRSPAQIAEELHALLRNGEVPGPYVLVGHSLAGKNLRMFARAYPSEVIGMVLVDARSERMDIGASKADTDAFAASLRGQGTQYTVARRLGIARLLGASLIDLPLISPALAQEMALLQTGPNAIAETTAEGLARSDDDATLASFTLGSMPLIVIAAGDSLSTIPGWRAAQEGLATLSTRGRLVVAEDSHHAVHLEAPTIVVDAVREVLTAARDQL